MEFLELYLNGLIFGYVGIHVNKQNLTTIGLALEKTILCTNGFTAGSKFFFTI